jgi:decaprenyl-phosphate phosphoribosyltransferase
LEFLTAAINVTRLKQWIKNLLVAAAPVAAGQFSSQLSSIILGVIGFTSASVIGYLTNDWKDRGFDRTHPKKNLSHLLQKTLSYQSFNSIGNPSLYLD